MHLPSSDTTVILVDEWGNEYKTSYLLERNGLSAGWRGFSISHRLLKGDLLIFRLIEPCKMKVTFQILDTYIGLSLNCSLLLEEWRYFVSSNKDDLLDLLVILLLMFVYNIYIEFGKEASIIIVQKLKKVE